MIVKVKTYKRIGACRRLLEYVIEDKKRLFDKNGQSFVITHNLKGQSIDEWVQEFKENETYRKYKRKNNTIITQEILSFHKGDSKNISLKKMQKLAKEYMRLRAPEKNPVWVACPHFDKEHWHIHIIVAAVKFRTGQSLRMSRSEFGQLKKDIQAYQMAKYPELSRSVVSHGRKKKVRVTDREYQNKLRTGKKTKREELLTLLKICSLNVSTQDEFFALLRAKGLQTYQRGGKIVGVIVDERKYRFKSLGVVANIIHREAPSRNERLTGRSLYHSR